MTWKKMLRLLFFPSSQGFPRGFSKIGPGKFPALLFEKRPDARGVHTRGYSDCQRLRPAPGYRLLPLSRGGVFGDLPLSPTIS
jgi:hypothetical protein